MAAPPVKSQPLHNFSLPHLQWAHRFRRTDGEAANRRTAADGPTQSQQGEEEEEEEEEKVAAEDQRNKPWKLRTRKEAIKTAAKMSSAAHASEGDNKIRDSSAVAKPHRKAPKKIWISLSREEIEEDVFALTGFRPSRKPRKWPKNVQKKLDSVFPGLYLVGYTADSYRLANL